MSRAQTTKKKKTTTTRSRKRKGRISPTSSHRHDAVCMSSASHCNSIVSGGGGDAERQVTAWRIFVRAARSRHIVDGNARRARNMTMISLEKESQSLDLIKLFRLRFLAAKEMS